MYRCVECRTAFVHPQPSEEYLRDFYAQFHETESLGGTYHAFEARSAADFDAKIDKMFSLGIRPDARVLDVGCGKGFFVKACQSRGLNASGVDISESAIRYATETLGVRATCGCIEDVPAERDLYDAVSFWATIEHVADPVNTLRSIAKLLRPNGLLFLDTGIGDDYVDRALPGVNQWYDPPQHLWVFSAKGLMYALEHSGFDVVGIDKHFERSQIRRVARLLRNSAAATVLGAVGSIARLKSVPFEGTKFPIGNLMLAVARRR